MIKENSKDEPWDMKKIGDHFWIGLSYPCMDPECLNTTQDPSKWQFIEGYDGYLCPTCIMDHESSLYWKNIEEYDEK